MTEQRSGGRILVECLVNQNVTTAFGVPGESYLDVLDALYDVQNRIRLIINRHEGGTAFMAEAYGKLTGRPGIAFVTRGPGATNAAIGVHTAMQNSSPMILFVGQIGREMRQREAFQEIDYRSFFGDVAKWVTEIDTPARIPEIIARAFTTAMSGRPGPVVIALPEDMLREMSDCQAGPAVRFSEPAPSQAALKEAVALLRKAERPLVMIGGGGWNEAGRRDVQEFVDRNNLPVVVSFRAQDLIDNGSDAYLGDAGVGMSAHVRQAIQAADLIFAVNIRLGESTTDGWSLLKVPNPVPGLIHAHISDRELGKIYQPDVALHTGPNELMAALSAEPVLGDWSDWRDQGRQGFVEMQQNARLCGKVDMIAICAWLDAQLDEDVVITNGAGNFAIWPSKFLTYRNGRRLVAPQSGAMGAGLPAALAAKSADRNRQVVCFAGDGDFQMTLSELGTAKQEGLNPIILLLNNGMYGTIRAHQEREYPARVSGTDLDNPDFVALAQAYGLHAERVEATADFAAAFTRANESATGGLIELMIDPQDITPFRSLDEIRASAKRPAE